jgi:hypothetical protein
MGNGKTGLLGEEDDEAILPLRGKGALAILPGGRELRLPLARGGSGDLGIALPADLVAAVAPFARGGAPGRFLDIDAPAPRGIDRGGAEGGARGGGSFRERFTLNVNTGGAPMTAEAEVKQEGDDIQIDLMLEQIDQGLARRASRRQSALAGVIQSSFGLSRQGQ